MNLLLTRRCPEQCAFCYGSARAADAPLPEAGGTRERAALRALLHHWRDLVRAAPPMPRWDPHQDERTALRFTAGTVNLLGGEPTIHPAFEELVAEIHDLGLGVIIFTAASRPERIRRVAHLLANVCVNAHFAHRIPELGVDPARICANLALRPGDDVIDHLAPVHAAGVRAVALAFATPAGGARGPFFTPDDAPAMRRLLDRARRWCESRGVILAGECAPPRCAWPEANNSCLPVPIVDPEGRVTVCGGEYFASGETRSLFDFESLQAVHDYTRERVEALRRRRHRLARCRSCPELARGCQGMCLAYRDR